MEPIFMYWNKIKFEGNSNYRKFNVNFNDGDKLDGVSFKKDKNYYITSLTTNIEIEKNLKKLSDYKKIQEISTKLNDVLKNGSQHLHKDIELKITDVNDLMPVKTKRKLSTKSLEFFDEKIKKKKKVLIYSPYMELKFFGLKFQKENGIIYKYHISLIEDDKENLFLEKKLYYNKSKVIEIIKKKYLYKNIIFMEDRGKLIAQPIDFTEFLVKNIELVKDQRIDYFDFWKNDSKFRLDFYNVLFSENLNRKPRIFQKGQSVNDSHPIAYEYGGNFRIKGGVNFYITPELYNRKQSIFRKIPEIPEKIITNAELQDLRNQLNDTSFTITKLFGFRNVKNYSIFPALRTSDFAIPDFNVKVETKEESTDLMKKIFEGSFFMLDNDYNQSKKTEIISSDKRLATIKNSFNSFSEGAKKYLDENYIKMKTLADEINFKSLNVVYENFFLYDLDNFIRPSYTAELQTEFSIYGLVNFSSETKEKNEKLHIIPPKNYLKFNAIKDTYKNRLKLELTKVHTKKTFEITDNNAYNFGILRTENEKVGEKRTMKNKLIDVISVIGIQKTEYSYLNPVHVHIKSESVIRKLMSKKTNKYRFVLTSLIFSSNIINDTDTIFLLSNGLNNSKGIFINDSLEQGVGVCYLSQINNWELIKGQSKRVQVVFGDSEKFAGQYSHFALTFTTVNLSDILKFSITLVDGENKLIKFKEGEENVPIINFDIEILE